MYKLQLAFILIISAINADMIEVLGRKGATLKPISACCNIPELGSPKPLSECSNPKLPGPCRDVQCVFDKSGFLTNQNTLNKEAYRNHLLQFADKHKDWSSAINKAIEDCVDKDVRQYLTEPCKAYDVFTCTGIAMLKVIASQGPPQEFFQGGRGPPPFPPNLPEQCKRPPQDVYNPHECCKIPPFFTDEDFQECGFKKLNEEGPPERPSGPPNCSKQLCMLKKYDLLEDETTIDYQKLEAFLDSWTDSNTEFQSAIASAKEICVGKPLPGPPQICEANKLVFCISSTLFSKCPIWDDSDGCQKLKNHMDECMPYFQNHFKNSAVPPPDV